ncbi:MAG: ammonia-forming cytochrome c nitrite reductase subunit c552 [Akkermansia sp.]|nr:ammonia-forming cytochrome c nitrite reductase subunit c552 [Akkermansia sp.]
MMKTNQQSTRVKTIRALAVLGGLGGLIAFGSFYQYIFQSSEKPAVKEYLGGSGHWNQKAVPISMQCAACHEKEFKQWASSHHAWAFRELDDKYDAEAFHHGSLKAHGSTLTFSTTPGKRLVSDFGSKQQWQVTWATGYHPLVQYLVPSPDGGYHTLSAAWDVSKKEWFDIFSDSREYGDWGHWLGRGMNWNSQCAWCHMSHFSKNYSLSTQKYASTWREPGVTCIQCHGPLLSQRDATTGCMIDPAKKLTAKQVHDNCASCHARREELDDKFRVGAKFDNHFRLELPVREGVFWPNGMQRDEDYCETGLRLSRMGKAGVTCLDCHNAHTGELRLPQEDNSLCMRCHGTGEKVNGIAAPIIDIVTHTPCKQGSKGARCVECHMPESLYMARDPRRDHSWNSPDPQMSIELGIPNACTQCHKDKSNEWARDVVNQFYGAKPKMARYRERTRAVQAAYDGKPESVNKLLESFYREDVPAWQATLLEILHPWAQEDSVQSAAAQALKSDDPLVRAMAVKILGVQGVARNPRLLSDPIRIVRLEAALAAQQVLPPNSAVMKETRTAIEHRADQPSGLMHLAQLCMSAQQMDEAERYMKQALELDPASPVVYRDYAVFLAGLGRQEEAVLLLRQSVTVIPKDAELWYLLGLGEMENGDARAAEKAFSQALDLAPDRLDVLYNRALVFQYLGEVENALQDLRLGAEKDKHSANFPYALAYMLYELKRYNEARDAAHEALRREPTHEAARQLLESVTRQIR